jgi:hypothetical protein
VSTGSSTASGLSSIGSPTASGTKYEPRSPVEDPLTPEELSELLAEATGTTLEAIERGAAELEIGLSDEATVVDE